MAIAVKDQQSVAPITSNVAAGQMSGPLREGFGEDLHRQNQDIAQRAARVGQIIEDRNMQIYRAKEEADLNRRALEYANLAKDFQYSEKVDEHGMPIGAMHKSGENAAGITREFGQRDVEFTEQVMQGLSDDQRGRLFDKIMPHRSSVMGQVSSHEAGQQKKVVVDIAEATHAEYLNMAANAKGDDLGVLLDLANSNAASLADISGLGDKARDIFMRGKSQEVVAQRIEAMLNDGNINGAEQTLEAYKGSVTNEGYTKLKDGINTWIFNDKSRSWLKPYTTANRMLRTSRTRRLDYDEIMNASISDDAKAALLKVNEYDKRPEGGRGGGGVFNFGGRRYTKAEAELELISRFENLTDTKDEMTQTVQKSQRTKKGQKFSTQALKSDKTVRDLIEYQEFAWAAYDAGAITDAKAVSYIEKMGGVIDEAVDSLNSSGVAKGKNAPAYNMAFGRRAKTAANVINESVYGAGVKQVRRAAQEQGITDEVVIRNAQLAYVEGLSVAFRNKGIRDADVNNLSPSDMDMFRNVAMEYSNKKLQEWKNVSKVTQEFFFNADDNFEVIGIYEKRVADYIKQNGKEPDHIVQLRLAAEASKEKNDSDRKALDSSINAANERESLDDVDMEFIKSRNISLDKVKATAKKRGISEKEVIAQLRSKGVGGGR